jgi:phenylalanyl-tRNA synthetase beta chain
MKVSLQWLRERVELPGSVDALVDLLTLAGVEVEGVQSLGVAIPNVVVAEIQGRAPHPNADRLSVCQIDDGSGTLRQIVCGAKNFQVGDRVPVALPGAVLPGDFKIKVGKLRGVESQGMLCSADELGLPKGEDGLLILQNAPAPGTPLSQMFPADTVLDLEVTPNRPDLLSVNGIAREIGALTGKSVTFVAPGTAPGLPVCGGTAVFSAEACPFYSVREVRGVRVGPSPGWLRSKLESAGLRSLNNLVDITNLVLLETGQPLHVFDADKLEGALQVRAAVGGEEFKALDGRIHRLKAGQVVIADQNAPQAVAGVIGGESSAVTESTTRVFLEAAVFQPASVRRTARDLGISTDSSYRFERGVDPAGVLVASQRAFELILELAGGQAGSFSAGQPAVVHAPSPIPLREARLASLLGITLESAEVRRILVGFGLREESVGWVAPSFRPDLVREVDLVEEVARVVGMVRIPGRTHARFVAASESDRRYDIAMRLRRACAAQGLCEARSLTLVPAEPLGGGYTGVPAGEWIRVRNPMIDDQVVLRPNLLHGLFKAVGANAQNGPVRLFELGRVFRRADAEETEHLAFVLSGAVSERTWRSPIGPGSDLFELKGIVGAVLGGELEFVPEEDPALALCVRVQKGHRILGRIGQLWPADARSLDARAAVVFGELDLEAVANIEPGEVKYREIPRYPAVTRDIALVGDAGVCHADIERVIRGAGESLLEGVELFDVYRDPTGQKLPADRKSLAYSLTYRSAERTLTADEVNAVHGRLREALVSQLGLGVRE